METNILNASPLRILCLGDSITQGPAHFPGGYRGPLQRMLSEAGVAVEFVGSSIRGSEGLAQPRHEGHSGFSIRQIRDGDKTNHSESTPLRETLAREAPDLVLLMIGTNDLYVGNPVECAAVAAELLDIILAADSRPALMTGGIVPILPGLKPWGRLVEEDVTTRVVRYNERVSAEVARRASEGHRCVFVDHNAAARSPDTHLEDGVHIGEAANRRLAASWFAALVCEGWLF